MRYLGGKSRTAKQIAGYLNGLRGEMQLTRGAPVPYWEPFVGSGWILARIAGSPNYASDANSALIQLWRAVRRGWSPPTFDITDQLYAEVRDGYHDAAFTAFVGYGCSFGGRWFEGIARGNATPAGAFRSLQRKSRAIDGLFFCADFLTAFAPAARCLIYCDPPYAGTYKRSYGPVSTWDPAAFWDRVRWLEARDHVVVVSEYAAPPDFEIVLEIPTKTQLRGSGGVCLDRVERLFRLRSSP